MSVADVLEKRDTFHVEPTDALRFLTKLPPLSVDMVFGSPPYALKEHRYGGTDRGTVQGWIDSMLNITERAVLACDGPVMWVVNGPFHKGLYHPAVEGLMWQWYDRGYGQDRPAIWHKNAAPSRKDWFTNDWEFILCFGSPTNRRTWNWEAIATPPKFSKGGDFRQRGGDGKRRMGGKYPKNKLTRPRDVIRVTVGGGHMGYGKSDEQFTKESNAPFPCRLVEPFVLALTNPGDVVCDPFTGSGTTARVCYRHKRRFLGCDADPRQTEITSMRVQAAALLTEGLPPPPEAS